MFFTPTAQSHCIFFVYVLGPTINIVVYYKLRDEFRRYIELGLDHAEV